MQIFHKEKISKHILAILRGKLIKRNKPCTVLDKFDGQYSKFKKYTVYSAHQFTPFTFTGLHIFLSFCLRFIVSTAQKHIKCNIHPQLNQIFLDWCRSPSPIVDLILVEVAPPTIVIKVDVLVQGYALTALVPCTHHSKDAR